MAGLRPILDDPVALNDALAANRNLFRDPNPPLAVDTEAVRRESFAAFERATGYTTLPVAADGPAGPGSGSGVAFFRKGSETPFMTLPLLEAWLGGRVHRRIPDAMKGWANTGSSPPAMDSSTRTVNLSAPMAENTSF